MRGRRLGWNDVIGNREEGKLIWNARAPHTPLSLHTSSPELSAPSFTPPLPILARPHLPLLINPDLAYEKEDVEKEEDGSSFERAPKIVKMQIYFGV